VRLAMDHVGHGTDPGALAPVADFALIWQTQQAALQSGDTERQAWRAAVGAYLERYPHCDIAEAERIVTVIVRPDGLAMPHPATTD